MKRAKGKSTLVGKRKTKRHTATAKEMMFQVCRLLLLPEKTRLRWVRNAEKQEGFRVPRPRKMAVRASCHRRWRCTLSGARSYGLRIHEQPQAPVSAGAFFVYRRRRPVG
jgi:hypothetical protein